MGKFQDLIGQKFGRLTVINKTDERKYNSVVWECTCECGNTCKVAAANLKRGATKSCGCLKKESDKKPKGNVKDLTGQKFYHLTVISRAGSDDRGEALWNCQCDCGNPNIIIVLGSNLRRGHTMSCGCERRSKGELAIIALLNEYNIKYEIEKAMFKFSNGTNARFDFYVENKYLIEYDGETHYRANLHGWHNQEQLEKQQERDIIKNQWCIDNNIPLIRIPYTHLQELKIEDLLLDSSDFLINH